MTSAPRSGRAVRVGQALAVLALVAGTALTPGCYTPQLLRLQTGLDSLRTVVDTLTVRDQAAFTVLVDVRRELADQREILLSTRATAGSSGREVTDEIAHLNERLDELTKRFAQTTARPPVSGANPNQLYDQATQDLTQGRYAMALQGYRDFLARAPAGELSDNAQYGVGESFFALSRFDSAAVEYQRVGSQFPDGDKVPASLYKLGLAQDKLGQAAESKKSLEDLVKRFPNSGEAQLARERLSSGKKK